MPRKGQAFSEEAKVKKRSTVWVNEMAQYNWSLAEPYLDHRIDLSSRNRKLKFLTLREFRTMGESGISIRDMREHGYCKHLLYFYSGFLKGKFNLTKHEFEIAYLSGEALESICIRYRISRENITFLRQIYDIKALGAKFQHRKATEVPLTERQKELIYGSLMGDAKRMSSSSAGFGHGTHQQEYLMWKYEELKSVCETSSIRIKPYTEKRSGSHLVDGRFYTKANTDVETILKQFYISGTKEITEEILSNLTDFSIAVWYMDDGCADWSHRKKITTQHNYQPSFKFCTESFSPQSCFGIQKWLLERWGIETRLCPRRSKDGRVIGQRVIVELESNEKFLSLIRPHILPMFRYKIDYEAYLSSLNGR